MAFTTSAAIFARSLFDVAIFSREKTTNFYEIFFVSSGWLFCVQPEMLKKRDETSGAKMSRMRKKSKMHWTFFLHDFSVLIHSPFQRVVSPLSVDICVENSIFLFDVFLSQFHHHLAMCVSPRRRKNKNKFQNSFLLSLILVIQFWSPKVSSIV